MFCKGLPEIYATHHIHLCSPMNNQAIFSGIGSFIRDTYSANWLNLHQDKLSPECIQFFSLPTAPKRIFLQTVRWKPPRPHGLDRTLMVQGRPIKMSQVQVGSYVIVEAILFAPILSSLGLLLPHKLKFRQFT